MNYNDLSERSVRERVNQQQLWEAWIEAERIRKHSYTGFLDWETRAGGEYLYSRKRGTGKSLGPRSPETEAAREAFHSGRSKNAERLETLSAGMSEQAAILRSLGLGRLPVQAARILRTLTTEIPKSKLRIVGTNALYAYEALSGVIVSADSTATGDIDVLVDDRNRLKIAEDKGRDGGLRALLQRKVDKSFTSRGPRDYRLTANNGYMVEFIRPEPNPVYRHMPGAEPLSEGDLEPAPIHGLQWLVNVPSVDSVVIDERGFPAPMRAPDPRYWAAHKMWLSNAVGRDPQKKIRDRQQGEMVFQMVAEKLPQFPIDDLFLETLPRDLRNNVPASIQSSKKDRTQPDW